MKSNVILPFFIISVVAVNIALASLRFYPPIKQLFSRSHIVSAKASETIPPLSSVVPHVTQVEKVSPTHISFPTMDFSLPVAEATIVGDTWTLYDDKAS